MFQKINKLEYSFPDGFPDVPRSLVTGLLVSSQKLRSRFYCNCNRKIRLSYLLRNSLKFLTKSCLFKRHLGSSIKKVRSKSVMCLISIHAWAGGVSYC